MKSSSLQSDVPHRFMRDPQFWIWTAISLSVLICLLLALLYVHQRETIQQTIVALDTIRQARIDLAQGFLHLSLASSPDSPFEYERGLALLHQALGSIEATQQSFVRGDLASPISDAELEHFRATLEAWQAGVNPSRESEAALRIAFYQLEYRADVIDLMIRQDLHQLAAYQQTVFGWTLAGAALLLAGVCVTVAVTTRARARAEHERERFADHNLQLIAQVQAELGERVRAEEQVRQLNAELEQRVIARTVDLADANSRLHSLNAFKDNLLAVTSHDLRSPLGVILNLVELIDEIPHLPPRVHDLTKKIDRSAHQMLDMLGKLLDLSRLEAGKIELELNRIYMSEVVAQSVESLRYSADAKHIALNFVVDPEETEVYADSIRLYQLTNNLISNAIKFTYPNGDVTVQITSNQAHVSLQVSDTGLGIPTEALPYLFERFRQVHRRGTANEYGSGLGLSIVRQLVELHNGTIAVTSVPDQGSTFVVRLPIAPVSSRRLNRLHDLC